MLSRAKEILHSNIFKGFCIASLVYIVAPDLVPGPVDDAIMAVLLVLCGGGISQLYAAAREKKHLENKE